MNRNFAQIVTKHTGTADCPKEGCMGLKCRMDLFDDAPVKLTPRRITPIRTDSKLGPSGFLKTSKMGDLDDIDDDDLFSDVEDTDVIINDDTDVVFDDEDVIDLSKGGFYRPCLDIPTLTPQNTPVPKAAAPPKKDRGVRAKRWCFTWNNPTMGGEQFKAFLENTARVECAVFQLEEGANGTPHFQGWLTTKATMYTTGAHAMMAPVKMALMHAKGNKQQNLDYCTKEEGRIDGPWFVNPEAFATNRNGEQGKRNDMDRFAERVLEEGGLTEEVIEEFPGHATRYGRHAQQLVDLRRMREAQRAEREFWREDARREDAGEEPLGQQQRKLVLLFGPTAVGKTSAVNREVQGRRELGLYKKDCTNIWWDNYEGEPVVLMDEFRGDSWGTIDSFNRITNAGVCQVQIKGGMKPLMAEEIWLTTNRHPSHWWSKGNNEFYNWGDATYRALARRVEEVWWWDDQKVLTKLKNPGKQEADWDEEAQDNWEIAKGKWQDFWKWRQRPIREGDNGVPDEDSYFTLI